MVAIIHSVLLFLYTAFLFSSIFAKRASTAIFIYSVMSSVTFYLFYTYNAADVALTEISIGVFLTFFFFYAVHSSTTTVNTSPQKYTIAQKINIIITAAVCIALFCVILYFAFMLESVSALKHYSGHYNHTYKETHIANTVTAILASYRAFDTLGETLIIAISSLGVCACFKCGSKYNGTA